MKTMTPNEKAAKQAKRQNRRIKLLRAEMRKDVEQLRQIIAGKVKKQS